MTGISDGDIKELSEIHAEFEAFALDLQREFPNGIEPRYVYSIGIAFKKKTDRFFQVLCRLDDERKSKEQSRLL